jgi:hypothetical protein
MKKLQTPSSQAPENIQFQAPNAASTLVFDVWCFSGAWSLMFGAFERG